MNAKRIGVLVPEAELKKLQEKLKIAKAAVEFYAMPEHIFVRSAALAVDKGYTAREALKKLEKK